MIASNCWRFARLQGGGGQGKEAVVSGCRVCEGGEGRQQGLYDVTKRVECTSYHEERGWGVRVCGCMQCAGS